MFWKLLANYYYYYFFFWWLLIAFSWIFRFTQDLCVNWLWHCSLAFSCVASLRTNFLEISLPHTLSNVLSIEELNTLVFKVVEFFLFIILSDCNEYKNSCIKKFVFFTDIFEDIWFFDFSGVMWNFLALPQKVPSQTYDRVLSTPLSF